MIKKFKIFENNIIGKYVVCDVEDDNEYEPKIFIGKYIEKTIPTRKKYPNLIKDINNNEDRIIMDKEMLLITKDLDEAKKFLKKYKTAKKYNII